MAVQLVTASGWIRTLTKSVPVWFSALLQWWKTALLESCWSEWRAVRTISSFLQDIAWRWVLLRDVTTSEQSLVSCRRTIASFRRAKSRQRQSTSSVESWRSAFRHTLTSLERLRSSAIRSQNVLFWVGIVERWWAVHGEASRMKELKKGLKDKLEDMVNSNLISVCLCGVSDA